MIVQPTSDTFDAALEDLEHRTLARLNCSFARLVYLASTRNYNTGCYEHDGLSFHYSPPVAERALAAAHRQVFLDLALGSLRALTLDLEQYVVSEAASAQQLLTVWTDLEAYRVLVPAQCDRVAVRIFHANLKAALAIVAKSLSAHSPAPAQRAALRSP